MSNFRDDVEQVRDEAGRGDLSALEQTLLDRNAERAACFAAANYLLQAGDVGMRVLQTVVQSDNPVGRAAAVRAWLRSGPPDARFLIEAAHGNPTLARVVRREVAHLDDLTVRLRCFLPSPFHRDSDPLPLLDSWAYFDWKGVVTAVGQARYAPALPLLILLLDGTYEKVYHVCLALKRIGPDAQAALRAAQPQSASHQENLDYALTVFRRPRYLTPAQRAARKAAAIAPPVPPRSLPEVWTALQSRQ